MPDDCAGCFLAGTAPLDDGAGCGVLAGAAPTDDGAEDCDCLAEGWVVADFLTADDAFSEVGFPTSTPPTAR